MVPLRNIMFSLWVICEVSFINVYVMLSGGIVSSESLWLSKNLPFPLRTCWHILCLKSCLCPSRKPYTWPLPGLPSLNRGTDPSAFGWYEYDATHSCSSSICCTVETCWRWKALSDDPIFLRKKCSIASWLPNLLVVSSYNVHQLCWEYQKSWRLCWRTFLQWWLELRHPGGARD